MKLVIAMSALLVCLFAPLQVRADAQDLNKNDFNGEFLQGMESGFFLRDTPDGHKEFDCPDPVLHSEAYKKFQQFWAPVQMLVNFLDNEIVRTTVGSIEVFIDSVFKLIGSTKDYPGSKFCSGVLFGMQGSSMLLKVGYNIGLQIDAI